MPTAKKAAPRKAAAAKKPPSTSRSKGPMDAILLQANKEYGEGTLIRGADIKDDVVKRVSTGSLAFDLAMGGGLPLNSWTELLGEPSNGKSVLAMKAVGAAMDVDPKYQCLYVASEDFFPAWAQKLGFDMDRTTVCRTRVMEEAYDVVEKALDERAVDAIIIDSLSALAPLDELEGNITDWQVGLGARLTNKFMRKVAAAQRRSLTDPLDRDCLAVIISQWREKVGVQWGDNRTTPYGRGKEFHYVLRVETRKEEWLTHREQKVGFKMKARMVKNKTAPPQRVAEVDFYFDDVITTDGEILHRAGEYDRVKEVSNLALAFDVVELRGSRYFYRDDSWHGKEAFLEAVREDKAFSAELARNVTAAVTGVTLPQPKRVTKSVPSKKVAGRK
jgi:recombination protein RecA